MYQEVTAQEAIETHSCVVHEICCDQRAPLSSLRSMELLWRDYLYVKTNFGPYILVVYRFEEL